MKLNKIHHVAVICSDYEQSKYFYTEVLGLKIVSENYREERHSWKADCWLGNTYVVELFSFPNPPARPSYPEAAGLRHLAFEVDNLAAAVSELDSKGVKHEPIRTDEYTGRQFVFFSDPRRSTNRTVRKVKNITYRYCPTHNKIVSLHRN